MNSSAAGSHQIPNGHSQISQAIVRAHAELLSHRDLQFDFPKFQPPVAPQWLTDLAKFLAKYWPHSQFFGYAGWVVLIGIVAVVIFLIGRELLRYGWLRTRTKRVAESPVEWRPAPEVARNLLQEADALAAQGKFADAVHLLLLRSIEHINAHAPNLVKPAVTSREIGMFEQLSAAARAAFVAIARVVERVLFAGREIGAAEFAECREAYERFALPGHWSGATR
jgi:hypothetical protein